MFNQPYNLPALIEWTNYKINRAKMKNHVRIALIDVPFEGELESYSRYYKAREYSISIGKVENNIISEILVEWA